MPKINVEFTKIFKKKDDMGNLLGFCNISVGGLLIRGCRYCSGKDGNFVATPSETYKDSNKETKYRYIVKVEDEDLMAAIKDAVEKEYES